MKKGDAGEPVPPGEHSGDGVSCIEALREGGSRGESLLEMLRPCDDDRPILDLFPPPPPRWFGEPGVLGRRPDVTVMVVGPMDPLLDVDANGDTKVMPPRGVAAAPPAAAPPPGPDRSELAIAAARLPVRIELDSCSLSVLVGETAA